MDAQKTTYIVPYSGKLSREKTFANFMVLWLYTKVFSVKFGAWCPLVLQKRAIRESFPHENRIFTNLQKFFPSKVSRYTVCILHGWFWCFSYDCVLFYKLFHLYGMGRGGKGGDISSFLLSVWNFSSKGIINEPTYVCAYYVPQCFWRCPTVCSCVAVFGVSLSAAAWTAGEEHLRSQSYMCSIPIPPVWEWDCTLLVTTYCHSY